MTDTQPSTRNLTARESVAAALARRVLAQCMGMRERATSRTALVTPLSAVEQVRWQRGLDALVDIGILEARGDDIGFSARGNLFLLFAIAVDEGAGDDAMDDGHVHPVLAAFLGGIAVDDRLEPAGDTPTAEAEPAGPANDGRSDPETPGLGWWAARLANVVGGTTRSHRR